MNEPVETLTLPEAPGLEARIRIDEDPRNPREDDNFGTMVCYHRRYRLGDIQAKAPDCIPEAKCAAAEDLYLYDHSGLTMNTTGFSCPWDSGKVGVIYATLAKVEAEYGDTSPESMEKARDRLKAEVAEYDMYLRGEIYGYEITRVGAGDGEVLDSCWGYVGLEWAKDVALEALRAQARIDAKDARAAMWPEA